MRKTTLQEHYNLIKKCSRYKKIDKRLKILYKVLFALIYEIFFLMYSIFS